MRDFLVEHLHDPHWREVILLLLGKLKPRPVTMLLRQILQGAITSRCSEGTAIVQQDLFFVCDCLAEEIAIENELVVLVVSRLSDVVQRSPFLTQRKQALEYLGILMQTRQFSSQGRKALIDFASTEGILDIISRVEATKVLYLRSHPESETRRLAVQVLTALLQRPDLSVDQVRQMVEPLYPYILESSVGELLTEQGLTALHEQPDLSVDQVRETAASLYQYGPKGSDERQLEVQVLTALLQRPDLSVDQVRETAASLYQYSPTGSDEQRLAVQVLTALLQRPDLSVDQVRETAESLYQNSPTGSDEERLAVQTLLSLAKRCNLSENWDRVYSILKFMVPQFNKLSM